MLMAGIFGALKVYGLAIVISLLVALLIRAMVRTTARFEQALPSGMPTGTVCPIEHGIPEEDVAALSAAVYSMIGEHRILHIAPSGHGWTSEARTSQHSHPPRPR